MHSFLQRRRLGAGVAVALAALAIAGCGSSSRPTAHAASTTAASAPACLPAAVNNHSARLAGTSVDVSPTPGTDTADPHTQISFLGVPAAQIQVVSVVGRRSGTHSGSLRAYSQGDGASFVPAAPFDAGEQVTVSAVVAGKTVSFSFGVDTPYSTAGVAPFPNPAAEPGDDETFATMPGVQAPILTVTTPDRDPAAGDIFTSNGPGAGRYGALIYAPTGRLVWFDQLSDGLVAADVNVQSYDGQNDLTMWEGHVPALGFGQGEDLVLNSHYQVVATVTGGNGLAADLHDFQIAPHGIAYITAYNPIHCDLSAFQGPSSGEILDATIEEIDMSTGLVRWEWHALDHVALSESQYAPSQTRAWDWFHINSIDAEPDGNVFISARNTWAGYQIQGGSGTILWQLGGKGSSFKMGPGAQTYWQHDGRILPDGTVTFFDDASPPSPETQARAVRISIDLATHRARLVSALTHRNPPLLADSQGDVQTLADGNTVVGWGGEPQISEYSRSGSLLFDAHLPYDLIFYRAYRHPWSAQPLTAPAVVANLNNVAETIVHMSWNGATGVNSWRVLAGATPTSLTAQATVPLSGFETATILPGDFPDKSHTGYGYVEVQGLGPAGNVLGTSHTVAIESYARANARSG
jgi:hypothetical protein